MKKIRLPRQFRRRLRRSGLPADVTRALGRVARRYLAGDPVAIWFVHAVAAGAL